MCVNMINDGNERTLLAWRIFSGVYPFHARVPMQIVKTTKILCIDPNIWCIGMNSEERHKVRYERRKRKRDLKREQKYSDYNNFEWVFSYEHMYNSYRKCRAGVAWKASVQEYIANAPLLVYTTREKVLNKTYTPNDFYEFILNDRGKQRVIKSVLIEDRVVQRCLCDYCLVPILSQRFIHQNGATLPGKGYHFTLNNLEKDLRNYYRKNKTDGYVLLYDFSKYFDNIDHGIIKSILSKYITSKDILDLTYILIDQFGEIGLGLGSQISQVLSLACANDLDHYTKEKLKIKYYGRFVDDGYLIHEDKEFLKYCLGKIDEVCNSYGIKLNMKKTRIVKLTHKFSFLQARYLINDSGKIIKRISRKSVTRQRRKLKKYKNMVNLNRISVEDVYLSFQSWRAYAYTFNSSVTVKNITKLYVELFK